MVAYRCIDDRPRRSDREAEVYFGNEPPRNKRRFSCGKYWTDVRVRRDANDCGIGFLLSGDPRRDKDSHLLRENTLLDCLSSDNGAPWFRGYLVSNAASGASLNQGPLRNELTTARSYLRCYCLLSKSCQNVLVVVF
jgi:hypothetical protein